MGKSLDQLQYKKSNKLITAKYKASGLENQLIAIALSRLEEQYDDTGLIGFEATIYPGEIRQLIKDDDHIYRDLKKVSKRMTGRPICLEDGKGNFKTFSLIPNADYEDRVFKITFNKELKPHIYALSEKYTTLQLSMVTTLKDWSFRIYEVLKKDLYLADQSPTKECNVEYRISEFRFMIGLANIDSESIKDRKDNPDWDELYEMLPKKDKKYERPGDLVKNVIEPAKIELAEKSDLLFNYELLKEGRFYKRITFTLKRQKIVETDELKKKEHILKRRNYVQMEIPTDLPQYQSFVDKYEGDEDFHFSREDLTLLLEKAKYDDKLVEAAIEAARKKPQLDNYMGWVIGYINAGGYEDKPTVYGNTEIPKKAQAMMELVEEEKKAGTFHQSMWESYRARERFPEFIEFLAEHACDEEAFIDIYGYERACKIYFDWNRGVEVDFTIG